MTLSPLPVLTLSLLSIASIPAGADAAAPVDAAPADCRPIDGVRPLLAAGRVLLLGELHGTVESPAFALDVACHAAAAGLPVVLGLELPTGEQGRVDRYLESGGTEQDRDKLLVGLIWQASYQDGRASEAMFGLIDGVRQLRRTGAAVRVLLFDAPGNRGGQARDRAMGHAVTAAARTSQGAVLIALTGNLHSRVTRGRARNADYEPLGYVVGRQIERERLVALDVGHGGGSAWICAPECGVQYLTGRRGEPRWAVEIDDADRPAGHHGRYFVGEITASVPARMNAASRPLESSVDDDPAPAPAPSPAGQAVAAAAAGDVPESPLGPAERKIQGAWQSYDYASNARAWKMTFDGRHFLANAGADDWYEGRVEIRPETEPPGIDFTIEDCHCDMKGTTSKGIYKWEGDTIVIAAPRPSAPRPAAFVPSRGDMLRLRPLPAGEGAATDEKATATVPRAPV